MTSFSSDMVILKPLPLLTLLYWPEISLIFCEKSLFFAYIMLLRLAVETQLVLGSTKRKATFSVITCYVIMNLASSCFVLHQPQVALPGLGCPAERAVLEGSSCAQWTISCCSIQNTVGLDQFEYLVVRDSASCVCYVLKWGKFMQKSVTKIEKMDFKRVINGTNLLNLGPMIMQTFLLNTWGCSTVL